MSRIKPITPEKATGEVKEFYSVLQKKMGRLPNIFQNLGNSPYALKAYINFSEALSHTSLSPKLREQISLVVGQENQCNYCLCAHTAIGKQLGLTDEEIMFARQGRSKDPKTQAILQFVKSVVDNKGHLKDQEFNNLRAQGISDQELTQIMLAINFNMFTNYFNHITEPVLDFPQVEELSASFSGASR